MRNFINNKHLCWGGGGGRDEGSEVGGGIHGLDGGSVVGWKRGGGREEGSEGGGMIEGLGGGGESVVGWRRGGGREVREEGLMGWEEGEEVLWIGEEVEAATREVREEEVLRVGEEVEGGKREVREEEGLRGWEERDEVLWVREVEAGTREVKEVEVLVGRKDGWRKEEPLEGGLTIKKNYEGRRCGEAEVMLVVAREFNLIEISVRDRQMEASSSLTNKDCCERTW
uniref:Uncharacterized protein n=1 Tax=Amphimedon queenslandica TaxID=400682 RepID=A0A1X7U751_AMPQE